MESLTVRKQMTRKAFLVLTLTGAVFLSACAKSGSFSAMASRQAGDVPNPQGPQGLPMGPEAGPSVDTGSLPPLKPSAPVTPSGSDTTPAAPEVAPAPTPVAGPSEPTAPETVPPVVNGPVAPGSPAAPPAPAVPAKPGEVVAPTAPSKPEDKPEAGGAPLPSPVPRAPAKPAVSRPALPWEGWLVKRKEWSNQVYQSVEQYFESLDLANDMERFCPSYNKLEKNERVVAWAVLFTQIALHESSWNPLSRMEEPQLKNDSVTGATVVSEGLMQLSYQDVKWAPFCEFDWQKDKGLAVKDPRKTILDPRKNMACGIGIMARQVKRARLIALKEDVYWAVLRDGGRYSKIAKMAVAVPKYYKPCAR